MTDEGELLKRKVLSVGKSYEGMLWRPGQTCQCANFVRHVFSEAGISLPVVMRPSDARLLPPGEPIGSSYADSFAGAEVGHLVSRAGELSGGDIVMFKNTYGNYPAGVITHVGIMLNRDTFIHRPTADRPVERAYMAGYWTGKFAEGRRPLIYDKKTITAKLYAHNGRARAYMDGKEYKRAVFKAFANGGRCAFYAGFDGAEAADYTKGRCTISVGDGVWKARLFLGADGSWKWFSPGGYVSDRAKVSVSIQLFLDGDNFTALYDFGDGSGAHTASMINAEAVYTV